MAMAEGTKTKHGFPAWVIVACAVVKLLFASAAIANVQVSTDLADDRATISIHLRAPIGDVLQTYLSPDSRRLALVLSPEANLAQWQAIAEDLEAADPFIQRVSTEGFRGGPGIVLQLREPVTLTSETLSVIDAESIRWSVELLARSRTAPDAAPEDRATEAPPPDTREDRQPLALASVESRPRGDMLELTLLGRRDLMAEVIFESDPERLILRFPAGQRLGLRRALADQWPELLGDPVRRRSRDGEERLIFEPRVPLDLIGATSELDAERALSRTRLLFGRDSRPSLTDDEVPRSMRFSVADGPRLTVTGDPTGPVQAYLLADPPRLIVDLPGVTPDQARPLLSELEESLDGNYVVGFEMGRSRLGSARVRLDLARAYAAGLALDMIPFVRELDTGEVAVALPETTRILDGIARSAEPISLEAGGLRLSLPEGFADEMGVAEGLGSTLLLDEFYTDLDVPAEEELGERFSLRRAFRDALARDPQYQAALAAARAEREALPQAVAGYLPQVALVGNRSYSEQDVRASGTLETGRTDVSAWSYSLEVSQPVLNAPALQQIRQARVVVEQTKAAVQAAQQDLILRVAQSYLQVLQALDEAEVARAEREALQAQFDVAEQRFLSGLGERNELNDARSSLAIARARQIQADNQLDDARLALKEIVGVEVAGLDGFRGDFNPSLPFPDEPSVWIQAAETNNPALRSQLLSNRIARLEIQRQRAQRLPTVDLAASAGRQADDRTLFSEERQDIDSAQVALEVRMPIYTGGRTTSVVREAQERLTESLQQSESERRRVERAVRSAFQGVASTAELMRALRESIEAEETRLQSRIEGLESGVVSRIDVLNAYRQYFSVRRDYASVRLDYLVNRLSLQQAVGTLDERDLAELDRLLDVY